MSSVAPQSSAIHSVEVIWDANGLMMAPCMCGGRGKGCVFEIDAFRNFDLRSHYEHRV